MTLTCNACGGRFAAERASARFCSSSCRVAAHRGRPALERRRRSPITVGVGHLTAAITSSVDRLEALTADPRFTRRRAVLAARHVDELLRAAHLLTGIVDRLAPEVQDAGNGPQQAVQRDTRAA